MFLVILSYQTYAALHNLFQIDKYLQWKNIVFKMGTYSERKNDIYFQNFKCLMVNDEVLTIQQIITKRKLVNYHSTVLIFALSELSLIYA